jgi:uncharacterized repeat protein (TIGR01451 family)
MKRFEKRRWAMGLGLLVAAATIAAIAPTGLADSDCDPANPTTDLGLVQTATQTTDDPPHVLYSITITNDGPCVGTNITVADTLPAGSDFLSIRVIPASASCEPTPPQEASETQHIAVTCHLGADRGPGTDTALVVIETLPGSDATNFAAVTHGESDPNPANDQSWGGFVANGGTISSGVVPEPQSTTVIVPPGHSGAVSIQQGVPSDVCPPGFSRCIPAAEVEIGAPSATSSDPLTLVFAITVRPRGIFHLPDGETSWVAVQKCKGSGVARPDPCFTIKKVTVDGVTFYEITVYSSAASKWRPR